MLKVLKALILLALIVSPAAAQSVDSKVAEANKAIDKVVQTYVTRFIANVPNLSNEQISDCWLVSSILLGSASEVYGKNPEVNDKVMLALTSQQQAWTTLSKNKAASGANMKVGQAFEIYKSGDVSKAKEFTQKNVPVCGEIFKQAQLAGMAAAGETPR